MEHPGFWLILFFFLDEKEPKNQGCIQILPFYGDLRRRKTKLAPPSSVLKHGFASPASDLVKPGFE